jgi:Uma2 family endonuclease
MNARPTTQTPKPRSKTSIPPLENGDRLTRDEFRRRYEAMPENVKAELIRGIVYMSSPVRAKNHGEPHSIIMSCLGVYFLATDGVRMLDNTTFVINEEYEPQPDAVLRIDEKRGGKSWLNKQDYLEGAPELIVEIASSTASYDLHDKLEIYERKGVQEYVVWRVLDEQIDWFSLENGKYERLAPNKNGVVESRVFPGLRLNPRAMLKEDLAQVLRDLQKGLQSKKYKDFVARLSE